MKIVVIVVRRMRGFVGTVSICEPGTRGNQTSFYVVLTDGSSVVQKGGIRVTSSR